MVYFCSDLDNTLIYSYRHHIGEDKILVEAMGEKELSYMTRECHQLLGQIANTKKLIPVTTRSLKQYQRIQFGSHISVPYALVANGGILLENGKINDSWLQETKKIVAYAEKELNKGQEILMSDPRVCFEVRMVDDLFVYTKSEKPEETINLLKEKLDTDTVYIDNNGNKVYIFPALLNKGDSVKRFRQYIGEEHTILAAGDSLFDIPMLLAADRGYCPDTLQIPSKEHILPFPKESFSREMLKDVLEFQEKDA